MKFINFSIINFFFDTSNKIEVAEIDICNIKVGDKCCPKDEFTCDAELDQNWSNVTRTLFWILAASHGIWQVSLNYQLFNRRL